jgi:predicted porin
MKKALLPLAIAAAIPMTASADVTVYGRANVSLDMLDNGADYSELNVSSNSSRLGFKGSKALENGMTAIFQIEQQVDFDSGAANASARDTFVGLRGDFGMVRVGQFDSPFKRARGPANLFGGQVGDMRNLTRVGDGRFDERNPNTIHYQTPAMGDFKFDLAYSVHQPQTALDGAKDEAITLGVTYAAGALDFAAAYEAYGEDHSRGERSGLRAAAGYKLSSDLKLVGFFQTLDHEVDDALTSDVIGVGAEYKLAAKTTLRSHYLMRSSDVDNADTSLFAVGIEQRLDSAVRVYANYAMTANDDNIALTPWSQGRSATPAGAPGEDSTGLSVGLRFDF